MPNYAVSRGATNYIARVFVQDVTAANTGLTGLVYNSSGLSCYYCRAGDATTTAVTLVSASLGTYTSGGFKGIGHGWYEFGVPSACLASGTSVVFWFSGAANMGDEPLEIEIDSVNYQDSVRFGLTALPNASAGASGGLALANGSGNVGADIQTIKGQSVTSTAGFSFDAQTTSQGTITTNLNTTISSRAATTALPANFSTLAITAGQSIGTSTFATGGNVTVPAGSLGDLPNIAPASTALSTANWTNARAGYLDALNGLAANAAAAVWGAATRTLSAFGFNVTVATNNDKSGYSAAATNLPAKYPATLTASDVTGNLPANVLAVDPTAVNTIQNGLSRPFVAQTITPADTAAAQTAQAAIAALANAAGNQGAVEFSSPEVRLQ